MKKNVAGILVLSFILLGASKSFNQSGSKEDFEKWQKQTRVYLSAVIFNLAPPQAVPLEASFGEKQSRHGYQITRVQFHDRPGHTTYGWLAKPDKPAAQKVPAIIALHGHSGSALMLFNPSDMYYYGDFFAKKGYIVLALDIDHQYLTDVSPFISFKPLPKNVKFPEVGQRTWMVKRSIDFLETLPEVDKDKIAIMGLSNGSVSSMFAAAMDERIKVVVASGSLIMSDRMWHSDLVHCRCQYLYKLDGVLDYYDIFALIAPRPLLIQSGEKDPIFPIDSAKEAFKFVQKAYEIDGAPGNVAMDIHNGKHEFRTEGPEKWIEKFLPLPSNKK
jgi:dipeptidyl aminopeptidase/acylaminoacyl peptidase